MCIRDRRNLSCVKYSSSLIRNIRTTETGRPPLNNQSIAYLSDLTLLVERQEEHPACQNDEMLTLLGPICLMRSVNDLHEAQVMPLPPHHVLLHLDR